MRTGAPARMKSTQRLPDHQGSSWITGHCTQPVGRALLVGGARNGGIQENEDGFERPLSWRSPLLWRTPDTDSAMSGVDRWCGRSGEKREGTSRQPSAGGQGFGACPWLANKCLRYSCGWPVVCLGLVRDREVVGKEKRSLLEGEVRAFYKQIQPWRSRQMASCCRWRFSNANSLSTRQMPFVMFLIISALLCWCRVFYYGLLCKLLWWLCLLSLYLTLFSCLCSSFIFSSSHGISR